MTEIYPLVLEPILKEKVWGGRRLLRYGKRLPPGSNVGESWEVADLGFTSPDGGGGDEARSMIRNGATAGRTLHDVVEEWGTELLGSSPPSATGEFPLLVKYLDARENLSVQVHPTADYVAAHPEAALKTESWHVIEAEPGAVIFKGLVPGATREDLATAAGSGQVVSLLNRVPVQAGDFHHLPAGTVHALGAGVLVAEVQTPSDTTYRLYDWASEYGRSARTLHLAQAVENASLGSPDAESGSVGRTLVETPAYAITLCEGDSIETAPFEPGACHVAMVIRGGASLVWPDGTLRLGRGETCVIPAAIAVRSRLATREASAVLVIRIGRGEP